jgi:hypothetical protein
MYSIVGAGAPDAQGYPTFHDDGLWVMAHEFCHSYCNPIVDAHQADLELAGITMFAAAEKQMKAMAYNNWKEMMYESFVRASVVCYIRSTQGKEAADRQVKQEVSDGFLWMPDLEKQFAQYQLQRKQYPTLDAFCPRIIQFFNSYSNQNK